MSFNCPWIQRIILEVALCFKNRSVYSFQFFLMFMDILFRQTMCTTIVTLISKYLCVWFVSNNYRIVFRQVTQDSDAHPTLLTLKRCTRFDWKTFVKLRKWLSVWVSFSIPNEIDNISCLFTIKSYRLQQCLFRSLPSRPRHEFINKR